MNLQLRMEQQQQQQQQEENQLPQSFYCPLTLAVMSEPVMDPEGNSYEKHAIEDWLSRNSTSPITRNPLSVNDLVANRALREAIHEQTKDKDKKDLPPAPEGLKKSLQNLQIKPDSDSLTLTLSSNTSSSIGAAKDEALVLATLQPSKGAEPRFCDLCCVVDVSGSMGTEATAMNDKGTREAHGLSLLDVVKHAVKTIINILRPEDRLSLVSYSTTANVEFNLIKMDSKGKQSALKAVEKLSIQGQTNLWDGLYRGLEVMQQAKNTKGRLQSVFLLTDGQPNIIPPRGHLPMLKKYKDEHKQLSCSINTFGFGYNLDSALLKDLAVEGDGMYSFIPDSGFVGTAFVHATSNLLATMATNVTLSLETKNGATIVTDKEGALPGGYPFELTSWGGVASLGSIQYEQSKDVLFRVKLPEGVSLADFGTFTVKYETKSSSEPVTLSVDSDKSVLDHNPEEVEVQYFRLATVDVIKEAMKSTPKGKNAKVEELIKKISSSGSAKSDKRVKALLEDLKGQVSEALSKQEWFNRWGRHYLLSLSNAHLLQMCNNFKDPGVQLYGGKIFSDLRDRADDIFVKLPPPKPSHTPTAAPVRSMAYYHSSAAPCFHPQAAVLMGDGTQKQAQHVRKGDRVMTPNGKPAQVTCVLKTPCQNGLTYLTQVGNLLVTPFHPVRVDGVWHFPCSLNQPQQMPCDAVYSYVLKDTHVMLIDGVECVTLGHNFQEDVVRHPYFGSQQVIKDLKQFRGWTSGFIQLQPGCLVRDNQTTLVCGLSQGVNQETTLSHLM